MYVENHTSNTHILNDNYNSKGKHSLFSVNKHYIKSGIKESNNRLEPDNIYNFWGEYGLGKFIPGKQYELHIASALVPMSKNINSIEHIEKLLHQAKQKLKPKDIKRVRQYYKKHEGNSEETDPSYITFSSAIYLNNKRDRKDVILSSYIADEFYKYMKSTHQPVNKYGYHALKIYDYQEEDVQQAADVIIKYHQEQYYNKFMTWLHSSFNALQLYNTYESTMINENISLADIQDQINTISPVIAIKVSWIFNKSDLPPSNQVLVY